MPPPSFVPNPTLNGFSSLFVNALRKYPTPVNFQYPDTGHFPVVPQCVDVVGLTRREFRR